MVPNNTLFRIPGIAILDVVAALLMLALAGCPGVQPVGDGVSQPGTPIRGVCNTNSDCDDEDPCTVDNCDYRGGTRGECAYAFACSDEAIARTPAASSVSMTANASTTETSARTMVVLTERAS